MQESTFKRNRTFFYCGCICSKADKTALDQGSAGFNCASQGNRVRSNRGFCNDEPSLPLGANANVRKVAK